MPAANHHIIADQGSTFKLFLEYETEGSTAIDLKSHSAQMQVRRATNSTNLLVDISGTTLIGGVTGGGSTGYFSITGGIAGTGGITLNASSTGAYGVTGGIYLEIDASTMSNIPYGRHLYDFELTLDDEVTRILEGRFEVTPEVTR